MKNKSKRTCIIGVVIFLLLAVLSMKIGKIDTKKFNQKITLDDGKTREDYIRRKLRSGNV